MEFSAPSAETPSQRGNAMSRKKVLVVDDEPIVTKILKNRIEGSGEYEVRTQNKGAWAVASAREFRPDLILLDVLMPDMDGDEVAAQIRADDSLNHTPIVFLTGVVSKEQIAASGGVICGNHFVAKPLDEEETKTLLQKFFG
jgi:CheY-like chemotaxis protein